ncbi:MAG: TrmB family transcriptional regulator [Thermoplasmata archaeon]
MVRPHPTLLELLLSHGLPEPAARIYLVASRGGPLTASELARAAAIHRVHGYRYLRDLVDRGLLLKFGSRPMRFSALPVGELLDRWIDGASEDLERLKRGRPQLLEEGADLPPGPGGRDGHRFTVIEGQAPIHALLRRRFGAARREIWISVGGFALARAIDGGLDRALREARERGVRVRVVTEAGPSNLAEFKLFGHDLELRHSRRPVTNRALLIDRSEAAVFVSGEEGFGASGEHQVLLYTTDPRFLALTREYHHRLWGHSVPAAQRLAELEGAPGTLLPVARGQMDETFQRLREIAEMGMSATGLEETSLDLPDLIGEVAGQLGREIGRRIEGRSPAEVARSLVEFYSRHGGGRMEIVRGAPLTLRITECFACQSSPEIGRVLCPKLLAAALESRAGGSWDVSEPDPTKHASRGCLFTASSG